MSFHIVGTHPYFTFREKKVIATVISSGIWAGPVPALHTCRNHRAHLQQALQKIRTKEVWQRFCNLQQSSDGTQQVNLIGDQLLLIF